MLNTPGGSPQRRVGDRAKWPIGTGAEETTHHTMCKVANHTVIKILIIALIQSYIKCIVQVT